MKLYFLRHGPAEDPAAGMADGDRKLTPEGMEQIRLEARTLADMGLKLDLILSSPYERAHQTAEAVARALDIEDRLQLDKRLAGGFGIGDLQDIAAKYPDLNRLMLVGHNPDMTVVPSQLIGGGRLKVKPGGLVYLEADVLEPGEGALRWLLPPSILSGSS